MAEIKTVLTDEEINARLGVIAKATPAGFHLHPIVKFINGTISTTKKGTVKFPIAIGIDQLGSPFTDLRAVASPNSNELIPFLVFVEPSAIEAAVLSANAGKVDATRRYEIVRKLNVPQFAELYRRNIAGEGRFDDLVDQLGQQAIDAGKV